jgi:Ca2+-transporting ATPase
MNPLNNKWLFLAVASSIAMQIIVVQTSLLEEAFGTVPLALEDWLIVFGLASIAFLIVPEIFNRQIFVKRKFQTMSL